MSQILVEDMCNLSSGPFTPIFNLLKHEHGIQFYSATTMFMEGHEYGFIIDDVHVRLPDNRIGLFIPFDFSSPCWECGGDIIVELFTSFNGVVKTKDEFKCWCYNPKFEKSNKNMYPEPEPPAPGTVNADAMVRHYVDNCTMDELDIYAKSRGWGK